LPAPAQANFEVSGAAFVDVYGIKLEGSTTIMWLRDSWDINLLGLGGSGDSFPNCGGQTNLQCKIPYDFHIPADIPPYNFSTIRIERTPLYKLVSLINNNRGVESGKQTIHSIHSVPLTPKDLDKHAWPAADIELIIQSMWAPWPGYALPPSFWSVCGEMNGTLDHTAILSAPLDRPILWQRGWSGALNVTRGPAPPPTNCPSCRCDFNKDPACPHGFDNCVCPGPWGDGWQEPKIHQSPDCLHLHGWHDMAAAITHQGVHHTFQGCPASGGWSHSSSRDLVHWTDHGRGVHVLNETYMGMASNSEPCAGFVQVDDENGTVCAGFRQCGSSRGTTGLNPKAQTWDVPMELRCALDGNLTTWGPPEYIYPIYYWRGLPYDPVRPWKEVGAGGDGLWYSAWSADGCNASADHVLPLNPRSICPKGGSLELLSAPSLHGPWTQLGPMFVTTQSGGPRKITGEFVTSNYFGHLEGDPDGGASRVVTQNDGGPTFWVGKQKNGGNFTPYWNNKGAVGMYDYGGALSMARTLGGDPNQVAVAGRKILVGWLGYAGGKDTAMQSLGRELTLSAGYELLQQFIPELQVLRVPGSYTRDEVGGNEARTGDDSARQREVRVAGSPLAEVVAEFTFTSSDWNADGDSSDSGSASFGLTVLGGGATGEYNVTLGVVNRKSAVVRGKGIPRAQVLTGPLWNVGESIRIHAIIDKGIIEVIFVSPLRMQPRFCRLRDSSPFVCTLT
jgi:hypothetical protein